MILVAMSLELRNIWSFNRENSCAQYIVGTPTSAVSAVERRECATTPRTICDILPHLMLFFPPVSGYVS